MSNIQTSMSLAPAKSDTSHRFRWIRRIPFYVVMLAFCVVTAFPIYWMTVSVIQPVELSLQYPPPLFPKVWPDSP